MEQSTDRASDHSDLDLPCIKLERGIPPDATPQGLSAGVQEGDHKVLLADHESVGLHTESRFLNPTVKPETKPKRE